MDASSSLLYNVALDNPKMVDIFVHEKFRALRFKALSMSTLLLGLPFLDLDKTIRFAIIIIDMHLELEIMS